MDINDKLEELFKKRPVLMCCIAGVFIIGLVIGSIYVRAYTIHLGINW